MATQAGSIQSIQSGKFFAKDENGNVRELNQGDAIYENDTVYGDNSNASSAKVEILLAGEDVIVLNQGQKQLIDSSLIETAFGTEELYFTREALEQKIDEHNAQADVESDLRAAKFKNDANITEEETTEGEEEAEDEVESSGQFAARDGDLTDVGSDLRAARFKNININRNNLEELDKAFAKTHVFNESQRNMDFLDHGTKELGRTPSNPFERPTFPGSPTNPSNPNNPNNSNNPSKPKNPNRPESGGPNDNIDPSIPSNPTPPAQALIPAKLSIDDYETVEHDGIIYLVVKLHKPAQGDIVFTYKTQDGLAESGKDFEQIEKTATIKSGQKEIKIPIKIINDNVFEDNEDFKVIITDAKGNVKIEKGEATVVITDRNDIPTVTDPNNSNPKDPNPMDKFPIDPNTGKPWEDLPYNPKTGVTPFDPSENPKIPGKFNGNELEQGTKNVKVPEGNDAVFKTTISNPSKTDEIVNIKITNKTNDDSDIERGNVKFYDKDGKILTFTKKPDGSYDVKLPAGETEFYTVVPTVQDSEYENKETFEITAKINETTSKATGTITDKNDIPTLTDGNTLNPKDPNPQDPTNPNKEENPYNPNTGIVPNVPSDLPKDPNGNSKIPGNFNGNEVVPGTKNVKVPEGNDAVFKTTISNPSKTDEVIKVIITNDTTTDSDIEKSKVLFYDNEGNKLISKYNGDGSYDVTLPKGHTEFYTVVPTVQDATYEPDEVFNIEAQMNGTSSKATGTITDKNDIPTLTDGNTLNPKDPNPQDPTNPNKEENPYNPNTGIVPNVPSDLPKDPNGNSKIPGNFEGNEVEQGTKNVKVPEGNDAVFKTTISNPSTKVEVVKVTITNDTTTDDDIKKTEAKFYDKDGNVLEFTNNNDGTYDVKLPIGHTEFFTVVPTVNDIVYEGDELFNIKVEINGTSSEATGTITDEVDKPKVGVPVDENGNTPNVGVAITSAKASEGDSLIHIITLSNKSTTSTTVTIKLGGDTNDTASIKEDTADVLYITVGGVTVTLEKGTDGNYTSQNTDIVKVNTDGTFEVTVPAGSDKIEVVMEAVEDGIYEGEEKYTISAKTQFDTSYVNATGTILDTDSAPEVIAITPDTKNEGNTLVHTVTLGSVSAVATNIIVTITTTEDTAGKASAEDIGTTPTFTYKDGSNVTQTISATKNGDGTYTLALPKGIQEFDVNVMAKNDDSYEANETYEISAKVVDGTPITAIGTITDTPPEISVEKLEDGKEDTGNPAKFKISLNKKSTEAIEIQLSTINGTAKVEEDFTNNYEYFNGTGWIPVVEGKVTIPVGETEILVRVPIIDDTIVETEENFSLKVDVVSGQTFNTTAQAEAKIIDNDSPQIESIKNPNDPESGNGSDLNPTGVKVWEGDDLVFKVKIDKASTKVETFYFEINDVTAKANAVENNNADFGDYNNIPTFTNGVTYDSATGKIKVPAGVTEFDVIVKSNKDNQAAEPDEDFTITIGKKVEGIFDASSKTATGIIVEGPSEIEGIDKTGGITAQDASAEEGNVLLHTIKLTAPVSNVGGQIVTVTLSNATATIGEDTNTIRYSTDGGSTWTSVTGPELANAKFDVTVPEDGQVILVEVGTVIDGILEADETYTINASTVTSGDTISSKSATGTIIDNNGTTPPVIKQIDDVTVNEGQEAVFKVTLDKTSTKPETFEFKITNGTDTDLTKNATGGTGGLGDYENDPSKLIFTNGVTYNPETKEITVPAGVTEFEVRVPTNVDLETGELDETFTITVGGKIGTGTIIDKTPDEEDENNTNPKDPIRIEEVGGGKENPDDPTKVEEDRNTPESALNPAKAKEGEDLIHTIKLTATPITDTTVTVGLSNGTATIGEDTGTISYSTDGGTTWLTTTLDVNGEFKVEMNEDNGFSNTIFVKIKAEPDTLYEGDEVYYITASMTDKTVTSSKTSTGTIEDANTGDITIVGNPEVGITNVTVDEGQEAIFNVTVSGSNEPQEFDFSIADGTTNEATGGTGGLGDYENDPSKLIFTNGVTYESGKITVPAGVTEFKVIVPTNVDSDPAEGDETFTITVGSGVDAKTGTGTIIDKTTEIGDPEDPQDEDPIRIEEVGGGKPKDPVDPDNPNDEVEEDRVNPLDPNSALNPAEAQEGEDLIHTIKLTATPTTNTIVTVGLTNGTATIGKDTGDISYSTDGGKNWIPVVGLTDGKFDVIVNGTDTIFVKIKAIDDTEDETSEVYYITASMTDKDVTSSKTSTGTILDNGNDTEEKELNIPNVTVYEGDEAHFKVTVQKSDKPQEYDFKIGKTGDTATKTDDYDDTPLFTNGVTYDKETGKITVPKDVEDFEIIVKTKIDTETETDEVFTITVGDKTATGTIIDIPSSEDRLTILSITDDATMEGGVNLHTVILSKEAVAPQIVTISLIDDIAKISEDIKEVKYSTDGGVTWTTIKVVDLTNGKFDVTVPVGKDKILVEVATKLDGIYEGVETYKISASTKDVESNITSIKTATGTITDALPTISSITDVTVNEGEEATFVVKLNIPTLEDTEYDFVISDGNAKVEEDYSNTPEFTNGVTYDKETGKITVPKGVKEFEFKVPTHTDNEIEDAETFTVKVGDKTGTGTIVDIIKIPGLIRGPGNGDDDITGGEGEDVIVADFGGVKTTMEPGMNYNMAFILDVSGSMNWGLDIGSGSAGDRMNLLKEGIRQYIQDTVMPFAKGKGADGGEINLAFITFSATASLKLDIKDLQDGNWTAINNAINALASGGNTNWEDSFIKTKAWFDSLDSTNTNGKANEGWTNTTFFITDGDPTAKVSSAGTKDSFGYISAAKAEFEKENGLGKISDVHAIGIGNMVNKSWLSLFDNTTSNGTTTTITIDAGTSGTAAPTKTAIVDLNNNSKWSDGTTISSGKIVFKDSTASDDKATRYESAGFTMPVGSKDTFVSFDYYNQNWQTGDSFTWYLEKYNATTGEWKVVEVGSNASAKDTASSSSKKLMQTGILEAGDYRFAFEVEDKTNDSKDYQVLINNFNFNKSTGTDTITGIAGNPDIIMTAEQLQYALEAGGLYPELQPVGNDTVNGGAGDDIIFGDAINTDWLEWAGRNNDAANQPNANGSGMAALKYYLGLAEDKQMDDYKNTLVDPTKGVQGIDVYNFIKAHHEMFNVETDERGGEDILFGDAGDDIIYGQGGDDILDGGAGNDILYGGTGDDTLFTDLRTDETGNVSGDIVLDGGVGYDKLILEGDNNIDFSKLGDLADPVNRTQIKNIEEIDLTSGKHQLLNLSLEDVMNMTDDRNELIIKGDGDDKVSFAKDNGWELKDENKNKDNAGFDIYTNSGDSSVKVKVETNINDSIII